MSEVPVGCCCVTSKGLLGGLVQGHRFGTIAFRWPWNSFGWVLRARRLECGTPEDSLV